MLKTVPMLLTLFRIAAIPGVVALLYLDTNLGRYLACTLFGIAAITDFFDGYLARAWSQQSKMGQFLDPVADKLLVAAALLMMAGFGQISGLVILPAIVILCREIMVSGLREFLAEIRV
ncbi:MAG: CDP-alcohol phosphatidyltransferase family protein, partial [Alphaproteobacteria bacterium]